MSMTFPDSGENLVPFEGSPSTNFTMEIETDTPSEEVVEHGSDVSTDTTTSVEENTDLDVEEEDNEEKSSLEKANEKLHLALLDAITDKFDDLSHGRITKEELKQWLDKNPTYHEKADRSKRLKQQYRAFMEEVKTPVPPTPTAPADMSTLVAELVQKELARRDNEKNEQLLNQSLDSYASSKSLKGDSYELFKKNVQALKSVHTSVSSQDIFEMAHRATVPLKSTGVNVAQGVTKVATQTAEEPIDLEQGFTFINIPLDKKR